MHNNTCVHPIEFRVFGEYPDMLIGGVFVKGSKVIGCGLCRKVVEYQSTQDEAGVAS